MRKVFKEDLVNIKKFTKNLSAIPFEVEILKDKEYLKISR